MEVAELAREPNLLLSPSTAVAGDPIAITASGIVAGRLYRVYAVDGSTEQEVPLGSAIATSDTLRWQATVPSVPIEQGRVSLRAETEFYGLIECDAVLDTTVPLGVDLQMFHPRRFCVETRSRWAGPDQLLLVHCGRLSIEKRADRSIDALAALRDSGVDARLVVAGDGPLRARLERHAANLPVDFTGFISSRSTVATLLASADVALAPGPHETFGLAALEALPPCAV